MNTKLKNFTPVIDQLVQETSLVTAVVFGVVWRYCQMQDRVCKASIDTLAERVGINRRTMERHLKTLCSKGYLIKIKNPGHPNVYQVVGATLEQEIVVERIKGASESRTPCDSVPHKDTIEDTICKDSTNPYPAKPNEGERSNPLAPETESELLLFSMFNEQRRAAHRRRCTKFPNAKVRERFRRAATRLDGNLKFAIDAAFLVGINSLPNLIAYVDAWRPDGKPRTNNRSRNYDSYSDGFETGSFATSLGKPLMSSEEAERWRETLTPAKPMSGVQGAGSGQGC